MGIITAPANSEIDRVVPLSPYITPVGAAACYGNNLQ